MKKSFLPLAVITAMTLLLSSCGASKYIANTTPEESGLNLTKLTDDNVTNVLACCKIYDGVVRNSSSIMMGCNSKSKVYWYCTRSLSLSPDGTRIAHLSEKNNNSNIVVRSVSGSNVETQRTFRNVTDVCWGDDNKLYFADNRSNFSGKKSAVGLLMQTGTYETIFNVCTVPADQGSLMGQLTSGTVLDREPVTADGGKTIFFTRMENNGPSIWMYNSDGGALTFCSRGFNPCPIKGNPDAFYCVRNNTDGRSEIWYVNYTKGQESCVLSDETRGFTQPQLSPDGKWILCEGNGRSSKKEDNLDIYVVKVDGTMLTQLTNHSANDVSPIWSADGKQIYFVSTRANKKQACNIWRMNFDL